MHKELERVLPQDFLLHYPAARLPQVHRYLKAVAIRARKGLEAPKKDKEREEELAPFLERLAGFQSEEELYSPEKREALRELEWMVEDYRVSLFAQELGTRVKVSPKRLNAAFDKVDNMV
jgi:ATP-dependent helicase HrpA